MSSSDTTKEYNTSAFYICSNFKEYYRPAGTLSNGETLYELPKKIAMFNKPQYKMTKLEKYKWLVNNKIR